MQLSYRIILMILQSYIILDYKKLNIDTLKEHFKRVLSPKAFV